MSKQSLERIARLLGEVGGQRVFTARRTAAVDDLHLEVKGIGPIALPVPRSQALKLSRLGRPAPYGRGEETLFDRRVRDTSQIPKSRVKIDRRRFNRTLGPVLELLRADLGLPSGARLKAELHDLLVYERGQFFASHQDSEKADDMVGTLVVVLPSTFKGGTLAVQHQGEEVTYRGSKERLTFIAFYADCQHQVRPVRSGHRIVLSYNLILEGEASAPDIDLELDRATVEALGENLRSHFTMPLPPRRFGPEEGQQREPPGRLVYLLDHQYTERGLAWNRLKGNDAPRASVLRAAAEDSECQVALALAEVRETWSCVESGWGGSWGRRHRYWGRDEDDEWLEEDPEVTDPEDYELDELVDQAITLDRWIRPTKKGVSPISTAVKAEELSFSTPSADLEPYASEYEGFMGNYGNTMDRWYRRAAVVVWPSKKDFAIRAEASPAWALDALWQLIRLGSLAEARENASVLLRFWDNVVAREENRTLFKEALRVAHGLEEPTLAAALLLPFSVEALTVRLAPRAVALVERYGERWLQKLLEVWSDTAAQRPGFGVTERLSWIATLPRLCQALCSADLDHGLRVSRAVLRDRWVFLEKEVTSSIRLERPSFRLEVTAKLPRPILGIVESCEIAEDSELRDAVVTFLCDRERGENEATLSLLVGLLRQAAKGRKKKSRASAALATLERHTVSLLEARLERPARSPDDWSLALPAGCHADCELCRELETFLSSQEVQLEWPVNKEGRKHVHQRIDSHELPVRHQTRRQGSPYTLVLTKTKALFEREDRERRAWRVELEWLRESSVAP